MTVTALHLHGNALVCLVQKSSVALDFLGDSEEAMLVGRPEPQRWGQDRANRRTLRPVHNDTPFVVATKEEPLLANPLQ